MNCDCSTENQDNKAKYQSELKKEPQDKAAIAQLEQGFQASGSDFKLIMAKVGMFATVWAGVCFGFVVRLTMAY